MLQVAAGNSARLAVLYDRYQRRLFNFFLKLGHTRAASEDMVQDSFLRMLRHAHSYRGEGGLFAPWMFRIARNVANDNWNAGSMLDELDDEQEASLPSVSDHEPANVHEQQALERRLQRALLKLSRENRELVLLSRVTELSSEELAQLFGCTTNAVKVRLHRSLLQLRALFDETDESSDTNQEANHAL